MWVFAAAITEITTDNIVVPTLIIPPRGRADKPGQDAYRAMIVRERSVALTLSDLEGVFTWVVDLLEPPPPTPRQPPETADSE